MSALWSECQNGSAGTIRHAGSWMIRPVDQYSHIYSLLWKSCFQPLSPEESDCTWLLWTPDPLLLTIVRSVHSSSARQQVASYSFSPLVNKSFVFLLKSSAWRRRKEQTNLCHFAVDGHPNDVQGKITPESPIIKAYVSWQSFHFDLQKRMAQMYENDTSSEDHEERSQGLKEVTH